jgi:hypothetical protein
MKPHHFPSPWLTMPVFFGLFFGGGYLGIRVSRLLAPDSGLAELVSFLTLPAAFVIGLVAWAGASIPGAVRRLARRSNPSLQKADFKPGIPPGSFAFVPAALVTSLVSGAIIGVLSPRLGFVWVLCLYAVLGLGYGAACWRLARAGYLPFPKD